MNSALLLVLHVLIPQLVSLAVIPLKTLAMDVSVLPACTLNLPLVSVLRAMLFVLHALVTKKLIVSSVERTMMIESVPSPVSLSAVDVTAKMATFLMLTWELMYVPFATKGVLHALMPMIAPVVQQTRLWMEIYNAIAISDLYMTQQPNNV